MKHYLILLLFPFFYFNVLAQTDVADELKKVKTQLQEQMQRNDYLKDALALRADALEQTVDDITVKLNRICAQDGKIVVEGLVKYIGDGEQSLQFFNQDLIDPKGNLYESFNAGPLNKPNGTLHIPQAVKDINYGFVITFDKITEKVPNISLLTIRLFGRGADGIPFNFKGVKVEWSSPNVEFNR